MEPYGSLKPGTYPRNLMFFASTEPLVRGPLAEDRFEDSYTYKTLRRLEELVIPAELLEGGQVLTDDHNPMETWCANFQAEARVNALKHLGEDVWLQQQ